MYFGIRSVAVNSFPTAKMLFYIFILRSGLTLIDH